ncbi:hypothetical protein OG799_13985 [Micromonospora sp. NBC_00898]|uniref:hypothetical protein n=1 Tax=Micromonospora sp. NBC_00898 TaxID=2975981 RepID=UPI0038655452|nr:hypothetical protein OG799_13985 [Micromonospora sp. NBC_00898]
MPSTFGQWLILILALLVGLAGGWVLRGRQAAASPTAPIVEGDPVAAAAEVSAPATATVDHERPAAVVDEVPPPAAVTEEPAPAEYDAPPAAATLAADATTLPSADADTERVDHTEAAPAEVEAEPAVAVPADDEPATPVAAEVESTGDDETVRPATVVADAEPAAPAEQPAPAVEETAPVVPAPRAAAENGFTPDAAATPVESETVAVAATNGTAAAETADDFRRIQGIGPKLAAALQAAGIRTYRQLGDLDEASLRESVRAAGLRAAASLATWPQQARVLAGAGAEADRVLPAGVGEDA